MLITVSATVVAESVTVNVAVRWAPVLAATLNPMVPSPEPDTPWVMVRNEALLTAPHVQLALVLMEIVAEPPEAGNVVVVFPVMTWHPPEVPDVEELPAGLPPQATATSRNAEQTATRVRRET